MTCRSRLAWALLTAGLAVVTVESVAWAFNTASPAAQVAACSTEVECIRRFPGLFSRAKGALKLKLADGKTKSFKDNKVDGEAYRVHVLSAYYPQWHVIVVGTGYYEGGGVSVVDQRSGSTVTPLNTPHFSGSGTWFAAVANCDAYCDEGIEIWTTISDPPLRVFRHEPVGGKRYEFVGWDGEDRLKVRVSKYGAQSDGLLPPDKSLPAEVVRGPSGWRLNEPAIGD